MFSRRDEEQSERSGRAIWLLAAGAAVGIGAAIWFGLRRGRRAGRPSGDLRGIEDSVIDALRRDEMLRGRAIDVAGIASGIVELSGTVESEEEAHHAVDVVQRIPGVRTVLNRLDLNEFEQRLNRKPPASGSASAAGSRWYGMGVGTGKRRQGVSTEVPLIDDRVELIEEALLSDAEESIEELDEERV